MKSKKTLAILLAVMMILSSVPMFASAAEQITLTRDNVTTWVTLSGKDGAEIPELYTGMKVSDMLEVHGGEVRYDANGDGTLADDEVVPGHFEFTDPEARLATSYYAALNVNFIPDDSATYSQITGVRDMSYINIATSIIKVTPVVVEAPTATKIAAAGNRLNTSTISGGTVINPITNEVVTGRWSWTSSRTTVNEAGEFEAKCAIGYGYNLVTAMVYVGIAGADENTEIITAPTIDALTYDGTTTWADVALTGGKAVIKGTETEVAGTFSIADKSVVTAGTHEVTVTFTPDDTSIFSSTTTVTVEVAKAPIKFVDENGAETVPEIAVPYGTKMANDVIRLLKAYVSDEIRLSFSDFEGKYLAHYNTVPAVGTHEFEVKASSDANKNYDTTMLKFKLTVEPGIVPMQIRASEGDTMLVAKVYYDDPTPEGTYDIYINGELYAEDVPAKFTWAPTKSGDYEIKAVYNPIENDPCLVEDVVLNTTRTLSWVVTSVNCTTSSPKAYGSTVRVVANGEEANFDGWLITDANGNEITLEGVDNTSTVIEFAMPDHNITVEAKTKSATGGSSDSGLDIELPEIDLGDIDLGDIDLGDFELDTEGDHKFKFVNIIQNLIEMLKNFIKQIGQTIEGIL